LKRSYQLVNHSNFPINEILFVHREGNATFVLSLALLPPGRAAKLILDDLRVSDVRQATWDALRKSLVDPTTPEPPTVDNDRSRCAMARNPADAFKHWSSPLSRRGRPDPVGLGRALLWR